MRKLFLFTIGLVACCVFGLTSPLSAEPVNKAKSRETTVKAAKKHQAPTDSVKASNDQTPSKRLRVGRTLSVKKEMGESTRKSKKYAKKSKPVQETSLSALPSGPLGSDDDFVEHRIKRGETLERIAALYNVEEDEIVEINNLARKKLSPGKTILVPKSSEDGDKDEGFIDLSVYSVKTWKSKDEPIMLVKVAKGFVGAPYKLGGESVRGLDCSAFVKKIYGIFDVPLPRSAREQHRVGYTINKDDLAVGDLVFFRTRRYAKHATHVGIYIGDGNFIHSSSGHGKIGVKVDSLSSDYYSRAYLGAKRVKKTTTGDDNVSLSNQGRSDNS